jgi:hypothetical protein
MRAFQAAASGQYEAKALERAKDSGSCLFLSAIASFDNSSAIFLSSVDLGIAALSGFVPD